MILGDKSAWSRLRQLCPAGKSCQGSPRGPGNRRPSGQGERDQGHHELLAAEPADVPDRLVGPVRGSPAVGQKQQAEIAEERSLYPRLPGKEAGKDLGPEMCGEAGGQIPPEGQGRGVIRGVQSQTRVIIGPPLRLGSPNHTIRLGALISLFRFGAQDHFPQVDPHCSTSRKGSLLRRERPGSCAPNPLPTTCRLILCLSWFARVRPLMRAARAIPAIGSGMDRMRGEGRHRQEESGNRRMILTALAHDLAYLGTRRMGGIYINGR